MSLEAQKTSGAKSPARIWVLSELYYPEGSATGYYLTKIAEGLAQERPVSVLCAQPTYSARGTKAPWTEQRNGVAIRRCWGTTLDKDRLAFRTLNLLSISVSVLWRALRAVRRGEPILAVTNPPTLPFVAAMVARVKRSPYVVLVHDVYPDVLVAAGLSRPESLGVRMVGAAHRWLYSHASAVVVLGRDMQALVEGRAVERRGEVVIIPNWADIDTITPAPRSTNPLLKELHLEEKFVVQYSGNMGRTHDLESIVECARRCADEPDIHFLFLGWGAKEPWLRRTVAASHLSNITILPPRPRSEIPVSLNACDLAVISFMPKMAGVSVPSRMYNVMAAGKPIIAVADPESEIARLVREEALGWVVEPQRPDRLLAAVREARADQASRASMGARARCAAETKYSPESVMVKYNRLFDVLAAPQRRSV